MKEKTDHMPSRKPGWAFLAARTNNCAEPGAEREHGVLRKEQVVHSGCQVKLTECVGRDKPRARGRRQEPDQEVSGAMA